MARHQFSKLAFAIVLAVAAKADTITYSFSADSVAITGRHAELDGDFSLPRFDPSLGTLQSLSFDFSAGGWVGFDEISNASGNSYETVFVNSRTDLLGIDYKLPLARFLEVSSRCGDVPNALLATCLPASTSSAYEYSVLHGVLTDHSATVTPLIPDGFSAPSWPTPPLLSSFVGNSPFDLTMLFAFDANPSSGCCDVFGDLTLFAFAADFSLTYNYTAPPVAESFTVVNPEPRYVVLLGAVLLLATLRRHHVRA